MNYFSSCRTKEDAKKRFRHLCMQLHPDRGGSNEQMSELKRQYENFQEDPIFKTNGSGYSFFNYAEFLARESAQNIKMQEVEYLKAVIQREQEINNILKRKINTLECENNYLQGELNHFKNRADEIRRFYMSPCNCLKAAWNALWL